MDISHGKTILSSAPQLYRSTYKFHFKPPPIQASVGVNTMACCDLGGADDFPLPPPPTPLITDCDPFTGASVEPPFMHNQNGAAFIANFNNNDYIHLCNLPSYVQATLLRPLAPQKEEKRYITKVQVMVSSSRKSDQRQFVESDPLSACDHIDSTMGDLKSFQWFSGEHDPLHENATPSISNYTSSAHGNVLRSYRPRYVKPRRNFLALPHQTPLSKMGVRLSHAVSSPGERRKFYLDEKVSSRLSFSSTKSKAIQTTEFSDSSSIERLLRENALVNYERILNSREQLAFPENINACGVEDATNCENCSAMDLTQPYNGFQFSPPNYNRQWLAPQTKVQVQTEKVDLVERATSPVNFLSLRDTLQPEVHKVIPTVNVSANVNASSTPKRTVPHKKERKNYEKKITSVQDDFLVAVATSPSPILMCDVLQKGTINDSVGNSAMKFVNEGQNPTQKDQEPQKQCFLGPKKAFTYATVLTSESVEMCKEANGETNIVLIDDITPLSPSANPALGCRLLQPPTSLYVRDQGDAVGQRNKKALGASNRPLHCATSQNMHDTATTATLIPSFDLSGNRMNSSQREIVSSVSFAHRPICNRSSCNTCSSSTSQSCSSYTYSTSGTGPTSRTTTLDTTHLRGNSLAQHPTMQTDCEEDFPGPPEPGLPKVNVVRATPERRVTTALCPEASLVEARATQTLCSNERTVVDLDVLRYVPDEKQRQMVQDWLVNRVSANVAMHFGSKLSQMLHESASLQSEVDEGSCKEAEPPRANKKHHKGTAARGGIPVKSSEKRGGSPSEQSNDNESCSSIATVELPATSGVRNESVKRRERNAEHELVLRAQKGSPLRAMQSEQTQNQPNRVSTPPLPQSSLPRIRIRPRAGDTKTEQRTSVHYRMANGDLHRFEKSFPFEQTIEVGEHDELVQSHQNPHDRRIKAVGMKTGCVIMMRGPIKRTPLDGNLRRDRDFYELVIGAPSKEKADRCINYLRDTFPRTVLPKKTIRSSRHSKI